VLVTLSTFVDLVAYAVAFPVLPDFARRLGASPTVIGVLFGAFGLTLLIVSIPMGAVSDRVGRRGPLIGGMLALSGATAIFGIARSLPMLFLARLVQGGADAITWVVGFALVADLYEPDERGRVMGLVMSGTSFGVMIGPSIGGWLYELGGVELPFMAVAAAALALAIAFLFVRPPAPREGSTPVPFAQVLRIRPVAVCAAMVVIGGSTVAMLEPVLPLFLSAHLGLGPARIGLLFGIAAITSITMPPLVGRLADRVGGRRLAVGGIVAMALVLPLQSYSRSLTSAAALIVLEWASAAFFITPSLAYMAEAIAYGGIVAYGVAYGVYNVAWAVGLLGGPPLGGFVFQHAGFRPLVYGWSAAMLAAVFALSKVQSGVRTPATPDSEAHV
jgi:multidrug resistance protein